VIVAVEWQEDVDQSLVVTLHGPGSQYFNLGFKILIKYEALGLADVFKHLLDDLSLLKELVVLSVSLLGPLGADFLELVQAFKDRVHLPALANVHVFLECMQELRREFCNVLQIKDTFFARSDWR
jgi:hypothetical protein